jgi:ubiquinone/menaquinone biosynthesis C-methylase UbiE
MENIQEQSVRTLLFLRFDPTVTSWRCGRYKAENFVLASAIGEQIPFSDQSVDVVCAYQVLEHVKSPRKIVYEMLRVLKPGGYLHIRMPHYCRFYEPHYKIFWIPFLNKRLARVYLRLRRRPADFVDDFYYVTPWQIRNLFDSTLCVYRDLIQERLDKRLQELYQSGRNGKGHFGLSFGLSQLPGPVVKLLLSLYRMRISRQEYLVKKL